MLLLSMNQKPTLKHVMKKTKLLLFAIVSMIFIPAFAQTTSINGLVVVVRYNDYKINATNAQIDAMLNQESGFNLWGNTTSVKEFYKTQSDGKFLINSTIVDVQLAQNSSYYHGSNLPYDGGQLLVKDVVAAVNAKYPSGFSGLTLHPTEDRLWHFSIISQSAPTEGAGVNYGLTETQYVLNNGTSMPIRGVALISYRETNAYDVNVICHEYGHGIFAWTDYYRTAFCNLGDYDVMASAGTTKAPMPLNPGLRLQKGWIGNVIEISGTTTANYTLTANSYSQIHKYTNPNNPKEYLLFHALIHGGYYQPVLDNGKVMDQGLAIWYVDEDSKFDVAGVDKQYFIRLVQADNVDEMHDEFTPNPADLRGDLDDLYDNISNSFPNGNPFRWKDGGEFGISISNISAPGTTMSFTVNARPNTVIATTDGKGNISPKGTLSVAAGQSKSFSFTPNPGYEIDAIKVNGAQVATANPYVLTGISGTMNISFTFKKKSPIDPLPSPWLKADIGYNSNAGLAAQSTGKFNVESYGGYMGGSSDNCTFLYQPLNGDGTIIAKISESNKVSWNEKVGIMIRESLQDNAIVSTICKVPHSGISIEQRTATGGALGANPNNIGNLHVYELFNWLKLVRNGSVIMSYCSRDGVNWTTVAQQSITMNAQVYVGAFATGANGTNVSRSIFENISVTNSTGNNCTFTSNKITGTVIGTLGSWNNSGNTREKAFDGNIFTYFDADQDIAWTGLSLSKQVKVTGIKYFPRQGAAYRMVGGKFQGSNTADFSTGVVDLATITTEPPYDWSCITVTNNSSFQYLRYISPAGGVGNVSEIEFYGTEVVTNIAPTVSITSPTNNGTYSTPVNIGLAANASDSDGTISKVEFFIGTNTTPIGTDVTAPYSYTWSNVPAGTYTITAKATDNLGAVTASTPVNITVTNSSQQTPYGGTAWAIPGTIEAENYDIGGQGIAFNDVDGANQGGAFRTDAVDLEACSMGGYDLGWIVTDEWVEYTVNVSAGNYSIDARVATTGNGKTFRMELDGISIASFNVPNTGGWQNWQTVSATGITLTAGQKVLRIYATSTDFNIDKVIFTKTNIAPTISITSPANNTSFNAPASINITANASDADGTISKVEFFNGSTLLGTDVSSPYSFGWTNVTAGTYMVTAKATDNGGAVATSSSVAITVNNTSTQTPYNGVAIAIPGTVEAEYYDLGGQGIAFNDVDAANQGGAFRADAVDMEACSNGGYNLGWIVTDEWVEYTVNVTTPGIYSLDARVATIYSGKTFRVDLDGAPLANFNVPNTGSWQNWSSALVNSLSLTAGQKVLRIYATSTDFNIDKIIFNLMASTAREGNLDHSDLVNKISSTPNPFSEQLSLSIEMEKEGAASVTILDQSGVVVATVVEGYLEQGHYSYLVNTSSLAPGMYIVKYVNANGVETQKLIKQ